MRNEVSSVFGAPAGGVCFTYSPEIFGANGQGETREEDGQEQTNETLAWDNGCEESARLGLRNKGLKVCHRGLVLASGRRPPTG